MRNADIAMYRAKSRGKAGYVVFDEAMHADRGDPLADGDRLAPGNKHGQFRLHFQPIVSLRTGQIRSFEALLRWNHPERGLVCPDDFIALAEETKLILPIGLWVIRTAAGQLRKWQRQFRMNPPLSISVNLSCRQFLQPDLVDQVERSASGDRARSALPEDGDHRERTHGTARVGDVRALQAEIARHQAGHGRLRKGLFIAQLSPSVPV